MDITTLLATTKQNDASDLHLSPGQPPINRIHGELRRLGGDPLTGDQIRQMVYAVMSEHQRANFEEVMEIDFAISFSESARFRVNAFATRNGTAAVFRSIPTKIPSLESLQPPPILKKLAELERGIVLVTGPTGSGKSTTLAAMINHINETQGRHIITIEDPVEFYHTSKKSLVNHRELGNDTQSFGRALKSALREDPDVILVGEMRDHETISLALTAAETGHLVFGTIHSNSAAKTIDRIIDVFPGDEKEMVRAMLSNSLQAVVTQTLLKRADGKGRVAAHEILVGTNAVRNLIREGQIAQIYSMIQVGIRAGMQTMEDAVKALRDQDIISQEEANRVLVKASEANLTDVDLEKIEAIRGRMNQQSGVQRKGINISSTNSDPTVQGRTAPAASARPETGSAPTPADDAGYSF
ncbi:MAG: pilT [Alphaproteobacteria bacterium]|nr:pilT [Alphaproteobacteria bacterium]